MRNSVRNNSGWDELHTFGFEDGRSATEIATAIRLTASSAHEWGNDLSIFVASVDAKQAFDNVTLVSLSQAKKELWMSAIWAEAIPRKQIGGKCDICFQETKVCGIPL